MRSAAEHRYVSFVAILLAGSALMVLAHHMGQDWAALLVLPLAVIAWLETSLRRGRVQGSSLTTLHAVTELHDASAPEADRRSHGNAELFDLAAFRAVRAPRQQELAEGHVAPVIAIDFRAERQSDRIRVGA